MELLCRNIILLFSLFISSGAIFSQTLNWQVYNSGNSELPDDQIFSIAIDSLGFKWLGTKSGLVMYDNTNWKIFDKKSTKGTPYTIVRSILIDPDGILWTGTWGDGMAQMTLMRSENEIHSHNWINYRNNNSAMPHNTVKSIALDEFGNKWIGTEEGLVLMEKLDWGFGGVKWKTFFADNSGLSNNSIQSILTDKFGNIWMGTFGGGISKFDGENWTVHDIRNSDLPDNYIVHMVMDNTQHVWVATHNGGIASFNGEQWNKFSTATSSIPDNKATVLLAEGNTVWMGTEKSGLGRYDGTQWHTIDIMDRGFDYVITSIAIGKNGDLWVGTNKGLFVLNSAEN